MKKRIESLIKEYQCEGCVSGGPTPETCPSFELDGISCGGHVPGMSGIKNGVAIGSFSVGLPNGFNRLSVTGNSPTVENYEKWEDFVEEETSGGGDILTFNVPLQKFKNEKGETEVFIYSPRINHFGKIIFKEDCMDKIDCPKQYIQDFLFHFVSGKKVKVRIMETLPEYDLWRNRLVWKHLNKEGYTIIRGVSIVDEQPFIHIVVEDCMSKIDCIEITDELIAKMD